MNAAVAAGVGTLVIASAASASGGSGHADPVAQVALWLVVILLSAKLGADIAVRFGQPAVLGELLVGVALGALAVAGFSGLEAIKRDPFIEMLARIGILILLFEVGLESTVGQMLRVGWSSLLVATLGVITPFALGWGVASWLLPEHGSYVAAFIGATLTATSVGITARVLADLGKAQSNEARVILGAAVIDDVLGLVILAVVTGVIAAADTGKSLAAGEVGWIMGEAGAFLVVSLAIGILVSPRLFSLASKLRAPGVLLATGLTLCFILSWLAVSSFLVPVFFVLMGMRADLRSFAQPGVLTLAAALTIVAIVGKQACSLGVLGKGIDRLSVGIGMIPRGEVGLIFANIGVALSVRGQRIVDEATFPAVVVMVIVTTLTTPPALRWSFGRIR
jgi:Kef-type K+ transport system membrane component KefB